MKTTRALTLAWAATFAATASGLAPHPSTASGSFYPSVPAHAAIKSATGTLIDFGEGNGSGSLTLREASGSHDYYLARSVTLDGKAVTCASPPQAGVRFDKTQCPYWPRSVVLGKTRVVVKYWTQLRPDSDEKGSVRVVASIASVR